MTLTTQSSQSLYQQSSRPAVVRVVGRGQQAEIVLDDKLPFHELEQGLRSYLARNPKWFEGAKVTLNVGRRVLRIKDVSYIKEILESEFKLSIVGLWCGKESLETLLSEKGTIPVELVSQESKQSVLDEVEWQETLLLRGMCRSGTTVHNFGNLVILGDVNPGAEITADGDIVVFGRLAGFAHAGVNGNTNATILASPIDAPLVRIGPYMRFENAEDDAPVGKRAKTMAAIARVERGKIIVEPYVATSIWRQ